MKVGDRRSSSQHRGCTAMRSAETRPGSTQAFWKFLLRKSLPSDSLAALRCAVFGLGDSSCVHGRAACALDRHGPPAGIPSSTPWPGACMRDCCRCVLAPSSAAASLAAHRWPARAARRGDDRAACPGRRAIAPRHPRCVALFVSAPAEPSLRRRSQATWTSGCPPSGSRCSSCTRCPPAAPSTTPQSCLRREQPSPYCPPAPRRPRASDRWRA